MVYVENRCCNCSADGYPCQAPFCPSLAVTVYVCDECGCEIGDYKDLYNVDGEELCEECLKDRFRMEDKR